MSKQDRQKLSILGVLLAVLGLTLVLGYRMNQSQTTAVVQASPEAKTSTNSSPPNETKIRWETLEKPEGAGNNAGKKNVFVYGVTPPPPPPPGAGTTSTAPPVTNPVPPAPVRPSGPPPPPPPPPISLKFQGYATVNTPGGGLVAFIADDSRHYNVTVGEILMGRYRIAGISDKSVDIEDLEYNRRQTLPLLK